MLYVLNSSILPLSLREGEEANVRVRALTLEQARTLLKGESFVSAVGHEGTAKLMSTLLGVDIQYNRISVFLKEGDRALQLLLGVRLPEGRVLSEDEMKELVHQIKFNLVEVLSITSTSKGA